MTLNNSFEKTNNELSYEQLLNEIKNLEVFLQKNNKKNKTEEDEIISIVNSIKISGEIAKEIASFTHHDSNVVFLLKSISLSADHRSKLDQNFSGNNSSFSFSANNSSLINGYLIQKQERLKAFIRLWIKTKSVLKEIITLYKELTDKQNEIELLEKHMQVEQMRLLFLQYRQAKEIEIKFQQNKIIEIKSRINRIEIEISNLSNKIEKKGFEIPKNKETLLQENFLSFVKTKIEYYTKTFNEERLEVTFKKDTLEMIEPSELEKVVDAEFKKSPIDISLGVSLGVEKQDISFSGSISLNLGSAFELAFFRQEYKECKELFKKEFQTSKELVEKQISENSKRIKKIEENIKTVLSDLEEYSKFPAEIVDRNVFFANLDMYLKLLEEKVKTLEETKYLSLIKDIDNISLFFAFELTK